MLNRWSILWNWVSATTRGHDTSIWAAERNEPMRVIETHGPIALIRNPAGETLLDMGQNMVGWV